jgi:hypothetical protein
MSKGGGKGDKSTSTIKLPPELEAMAYRNLRSAENAGKIGYVPYQGPTVGALNEMQIGAMEQNEAAMRAFGMAPQSVRASIPTPTTYAGGVQGYSPMGLYMEALGKIDPDQKAAIESFTDPKSVTAANQAGTGTKGGGNTGGMNPLYYAQSPQGAWEAKQNKRINSPGGAIEKSLYGGMTGTKGGTR